MVEREYFSQPQGMKKNCGNKQTDVSCGCRLLVNTFRAYLISRFRQDSISRGFIFALSTGGRILNFAKVLSTTFLFFKRLPGRLADSIVGLFPREFWRYTRFHSSRGGNVKVTVVSTIPSRTGWPWNSCHCLYRTRLHLEESFNVSVLERDKRPVNENYTGA